MSFPKSNIATLSSKMFDFTEFNSVFSFDPSFSYANSVVVSIEGHRKQLEGLLVDKVFKISEIKRREYSQSIIGECIIDINHVAAKLYPPKSNSELITLHNAIIDCPAADHAKLSLLYYILLDTDLASEEANSNDFVSKSNLPRRYQIFMKGLWHMDRMEFKLALQYLAHPSLVPTFQEEILEILVRHSPNQDYELPLAYFQTVQPALSDSNALQSLFSALAHTSVTEAFYFLRAQSDSLRRRMFETLISIALQSNASEDTAARGVELISLPFSAEEEVWFETFLSTGEGHRLRKAKDTLLTRRIGTGRFKEGVLMEGMANKSLNGVNWNAIQHGLYDGLGPRLK